jgi:cytoskeleton protein RodZ
VASFGARLKQERLQRGITLDEISLSTKIGTRMLRALEEEHFDQLPGGIFNKGFVRAYAHFLGIDEEEAIADYLVASGATQLETKTEPAEISVQEIRAAADEPSANLPWGWFAVALLIIAIGFAVWGFYSRDAGAGAKKSAQPARVQETVPASNSTVVASSTNDSVTSSKATMPPKAAAGLPSGSPASPGAPAGSTARTVVPASSLRTDSPAAKIPAAASPLVLLIRARGDSWLSISVDGEVTTQDTLVAPAEKTVRAQREIIVKAGNVGVLDFDFNGKTLPAQGDVGVVKTLIFDARGLRAAPSASGIQAPAVPQP